MRGKRRLRPVWEIPFRLVAWALYAPARAYADWYEDHL